MTRDDVGPGGSVRVFLAVCEHGGFARAADYLGLTPSAVAKAVARLEARLQVRLFERTTRRFIQTPEGAAYQVVCHEAVERIRQVERDLVLAASGPVGLVRVSLPPLLGAEVIAPALYELTAHYPRLDYDLTLNAEPVDLLDGAFDLAVRIGEAPDVAGVMGRVIGEQRLSLCASASYVARAGAPVSWRDLLNHDLIASARRGRIAPWRFNVDGAEVVWDPPARLVLDGGVLSLAAIRAGRGIGLAPSWRVAKDIASGRLVSVLDGQVGGHRPVRLLWAQTSGLSPRMRVTMDAITRAASQVVGR